MALRPTISDETQDDRPVSVTECEEIYKMDDETARKRADRLLRARWPELVGLKSHVGRRARTLSAPTSLRETVRLADFAREADEEERAQTRGEKMLPDVSEECASLIGDDRALSLSPQLRDALVGALPRDSGAPKLSQVQTLRSLCAHVEGQYLELAEQALSLPFVAPKPSLVEFEEAVEQLAAFSRGLGWSDEGLGEAWGEVQGAYADPVAAIKALCQRIGTPPRKFKCVVVVKLGGSNPEYFHLPDRGISLVKRGSENTLELESFARDPWAAARDAYARVAAVVGAPNVFHEVPNSADETTVEVKHSEPSGRVDRVSVRERIDRDPHNPKKDQISSIIEVAARVGAPLDTDTLYDAIRNYHRAIAVPDIESAYILLWSAIERLCANPRQPEPILSSTADLLSGAISFSKVRREVQYFAEALTPYVKEKEAKVELYKVDESVIRKDRDVVSHEVILKAMIGNPDDAKSFCQAFYDDVRLTQWFFRLRRELASPQTATPISLGRRVASLIEGSRRRTRWQIKRLYRARNGIAHGASRPQWLADLARHASYVLTNAFAICLAYAGRREVASREVLGQRSGWLDAYLLLARAGAASAVAPWGILKPSKLFAQEP